ncbi:MAG: protein kinase [Verrucomicrobiia bacterium]
MPSGNKCPQCGAALPAGALAGLCPACLLKQGAAADTAPPPGTAPFTPPPVAELTKLFPQLDILSLIGQGGMGAVYKARQKQLDRIVALKILPPAVSHDPKFAERFAREARALAKLNHPNIVTLYEFGQADGLFYFLMEFMDGMNLRQLLNAGRVTPKEALAIVPPICDALQFAHDRGIVHRDIKPENILLSKAGQVKIADFGVAKIVASEPATTATSGAVAPLPAQTDAGLVMGTPQYMAPEQTEHPSEVDHRADIYSLGVVFYQMLTGELPKGKFEPPSKKVVIDVRLDEVVLRALEKEPERRYQQASEVRTAVETIATTPPVVGVPASAGPQSPTPVPAQPQQPRVRLEIAGAGIASIFFLDLLFWIGAFCLPTAPAEPFTTLASLGLPFALLAPVITPLFGWLAVSKIRCSAGPDRGLGLAVFDGLLFPLLALDGVIGLLSVLSAGLVAGLRGLRGSLFDHMPELAAWLLLTIGLIAWLDYLIARSVWRAVNKPLGSDGPPRTSGPAASQQPPAGAPSAATNKSGMVRIMEILLGGTFTSPLAITLINVSALGFLGFLSGLAHVPLPGWQRCEGFSGFFGFFGLLGVAVIVEMVARRRSRTTPSPTAGTQPAAATEEIRRQVNGPAIGLLVTGILNWILIPVIALFVLWYLSSLSADFCGTPSIVQLRSPETTVPLVAVPIAALVLSSVMIFGALKMKRLEGYGWAVAAAILAILVSPGNIIGLPLGIWALVVLSRPEVRAAFRKRGESVPPAADISVGVPPRNLPVFVERDRRRHLYWPGVLLFCGNIGLVVCGGNLAIALALWLLNAPVRLTFQPGELMLVLMLMAACLVMRLAALKLDAGEAARATASPAGKVGIAKRIIFMLLGMAVAAVLAAGVALLVDALMRGSISAATGASAPAAWIMQWRWFIEFFVIGFLAVYALHSIFSRKEPAAAMAGASRKRRILIDVLVGLALAITVRAFVLTPYQAATDAVSPEIPQGSYVLVLKLARTYAPGDIVVYQSGAKAMLGRVAQAGPLNGALQIERRNGPPQSIPFSSVVGKVIFNSRPEAPKKQGPPVVAQPPASLPLDSSPVIARVVDGGRGKVIEGCGSADSWLVIRVGEGVLRCGIINDSRFTATIERAWWSGGFNCVVKDSRGKVLFAGWDNKVGSMTKQRGRIVFREGTLAREPDGSYVIGEFRPDSGAPVPVTVRLEKPSAVKNLADAKLEVLRVQLRQAREALPLAEAWFEAGRLAFPEFQAAKDKVELLEAEITGDPVQVARVRLAAAERQFQYAEERFKVGAMAARDYLAAKNAVELRQAELRPAEVEASQTAMPVSQPPAGTKPLPRLQFRLVADANDTAPTDTLADPGNKEPLRVRKEILLDESAVAGVSLTNSPEGQRQINILLTETGAKRFGEITAANIRRRLAIVFDGKLLTAPVIQTSIAGKEMMYLLVNNVSEAEAKTIIQVLPPRPVPPDPFGPVIERTVNELGEKTLIDLDTGRMFTLPRDAFVNDPKSAMEWAEKNGIDAGCCTQDRGLIGFDMVAIPISNESWDPSDFRLSQEALSFSKPGNPVYLSVTGKLPSTWLFKTREGGMGVLQITGFTDNPHGVKIRYKLVQTTQHSSAKNAAAAAPAKPAPRLQFRLVADANDTAPADTLADPGGKEQLRVRKEVLLDESAVARASVTVSPEHGVSVEVEFNEAGATRFAQITGANIGKRLAVVFDGKVLSAPTIRSVIRDKAVITGNFTAVEVAEAIAGALNAAKAKLSPQGGAVSNRPNAIRQDAGDPKPPLTEANVFLTGNEQAIINRFLKQPEEPNPKQFSNSLDHALAVLIARAHPTQEVMHLARATVISLCAESERQTGSKISATQQDTWVSDFSRTKSFDSVLKSLEALSSKRTDPKRLMETGLNGMLRASGWDSACVLPQVRADEIKRQLKARETPAEERGVLGLKLDRWPVVEVVSGGPAAEAGVRNGDVVVAVNGKEVAEARTTQDALKILQGPPGSVGKLTVKRDGATLTFDITRASAAVVMIQTRQVETDALLITIPTFEGSGIADRVKQIVQTRTTNQTAVIIFDLRDNPGGRPEEANAVADIFLDGKLLWLCKFHNDRLIGFKSNPGARIATRLLVLTNKNTASGAEALVMALRDNSAATLVGENTAGMLFGKDGAELAGGQTIVFRSHPTLLSPAGHDYSLRGIPPDVRVRDSRSSGKDDILRRALELAKQPATR